MINSAMLLFIGFFVINGIFAYQTKYIGASVLDTIKYQLYVLPIFFLANLMVGIGYKLGFKFLANNTLVVSSSRFLDIVALLGISYFFFAEVPSLKTFIGLGLVVIGIIVTKL